MHFISLRLHRRDPDRTVTPNTPSLKAIHGRSSHIKLPITENRCSKRKKANIYIIRTVNMSRSNDRRAGLSEMGADSGRHLFENAGVD